ncbi:hypothetical protein L1887_06350 [Cichorium endivia]|nr:hypothetical protein L1887_06350 [Cichorium endivia]
MSDFCSLLHLAVPSPIFSESEPIFGRGFKIQEEGKAINSLCRFVRMENKADRARSRGTAEFHGTRGELTLAEQHREKQATAPPAAGGGGGP